MAYSRTGTGYTRLLYCSLRKIHGKNNGQKIFVIQVGSLQYHVFYVVHGITSVAVTSILKFSFGLIV